MSASQSRVRGGCAERAVHEVGRPLHELCRVGGPDRPGPGDSAEAERGHEPADPITTDRDALTDESAPELADAIDAEVGGMDPADLELQLRVAQGSGRRWPGAVSVIARRGDCQDLADRLRPEPGPGGPGVPAPFEARRSSSAPKKAAAPLWVLL